MESYYSFKQIVLICSLENLLYDVSTFIITYDHLLVVLYSFETHLDYKVKDHLGFNNMII